ncbi:MAG: NlpC/P60 family protein [Actinobacteria bacterium]|nr:NlpC/P60 family protein [Actinomycetota bacterium]
MPSALHRNRWIVITLAFGLVLGSSPAFAKTPKPTLAQIAAAKKAEDDKRAAASAAAAKLAAANQTLRTLTSQADHARALYRQAQKELVIAIGISNTATLHAQMTAADVGAAHRTIGKLAANAYIMGGGLTDIEPLLSASGPQELADRLSTLSTLGSKNSTALDRYRAAEAIALVAKNQADAAKVAAQKASDKVAAAKKVADSAQSAQQAEVNKLQAVQDQLMKELASAKKIRTTLEQQRQLALLEEAQANRAAQTPGQKKIWPDLGFKGRSTIRTTVAQRVNAVAFARKQVLAGKPYVWGASGPNSFDCSGLVYAAFKSVGLVWPNWDRLNAALYSTYTHHVSLSELQPGDLLFYSYNGTIANIHHITIYAGDGMMWEARSTKSGLRYSNMYSVNGLMPFGGRV